LQGLEIGLGWNDIEVFKPRAVYERADLRLPEAEASGRFKKIGQTRLRVRRLCAQQILA
jgi:hypothetical protein